MRYRRSMDADEPAALPDLTPWLGGAAFACSVATAGALAVYPDLILVFGLAVGSLLMVGLTWLSAVVRAVLRRATALTWAAAILAPSA